MTIPPSVHCLNCFSCSGLLFGAGPCPSMHLAGSGGVHNGQVASRKPIDRTQNQSNISVRRIQSPFSSCYQRAEDGCFSLWSWRSYAFLVAAFTAFIQIAPLCCECTHAENGRLSGGLNPSPWQPYSSSTLSAPERGGLNSHRGPHTCSSKNALSQGHFG